MKTIDIVFDGPPSHESGRFVEVEDNSGASINFGEWVERDDGYWVLRIPDSRSALTEGALKDAVIDAARRWKWGLTIDDRSSAANEVDDALAKLDAVSGTRGQK